MSVLVDNVTAGDSGPVWMLDHLDASGNQKDLSSGYVCQIAVEGTAISRTVTVRSADNKTFLIALTTAETATLVVGETYTAGLQLRNDAYEPPLLMEAKRRIFILENVVP